MLQLIKLTKFEFGFAFIPSLKSVTDWGENSKLLFSHFVAIISTHFKCQTVGEIPWSLILDNRAKV